MKKFILLAFLLPTFVLAQDNGVMFSIDYGSWTVINPPATSESIQSIASGPSIQCELGYEFDRVVVAGFFHYSYTHIDINYTGQSHGMAHGDFVTLGGGLATRLRLAGFDDSRNIKRFWIYLRTTGAYVTYVPHAMIPQNDFMMTMGPGLEWVAIDSRDRVDLPMRRMSVTLEPDVSWMFGTGTLGFAVIGSMKYSF